MEIYKGDIFSDDFCDIGIKCTFKRLEVYFIREDSTKYGSKNFDTTLTIKFKDKKDNDFYSCDMELRNSNTIYGESGPFHSIEECCIEIDKWLTRYSIPKKCIQLTLF